MKKEYKLICLIITAIVFTSTFSCCVSRGTSTITTETQIKNPTPETPTSTLEEPTPHTGVPYILPATTYNTETVDRNNNIYVSLENFGKGRASNVVIVISDGYYQNFTLESVNPSIRVEGNRFYVGNIEAGEKFILNIYLKAKKSGVYTGTLSFTYDGIETSGKIKDLTTRVP
ncbi:MAG TPA: hypothetical protein PLK11_05490 [Methanofastidiosum sp.]|jgi:hypothetical protein|nr:hypothetical protein [Methanofastidiosum sp.]HOR88701.1 hypothetical protein [Methanofastidiosum sp.]HOT85262.1 hypothetical protein [Methanofastidiosum sp.]HPL00786.1 hypothetical protein [Methanofastidiosum sp.]HQF89716.1 hypothetical protein [Methanofastidiosum sp.]